MKGSVISASLALLLSAAPVFAQAAGGQAPARPATQPATRPAAPAPAQTAPATPAVPVPFRLIFYYDPQRGGVLDNSLQPQGAYGFRFAVGATF